MIDTSFLHQLDRFSLIINKRVTSNYIGAKKSIAKGRGLVIKDRRMYAPGDDIRAIDWKVYARTDKLHVKQFEEERNLNVHVIVDSSSSMDFGKPVTKFEYAGMLGLGYAYLALKANEKFQYCTFDTKLDVFKPQRGKKQLALMLDHFNKTKPEGASKLYDCLSKYKKLIKARSYIVLVSDFMLDVEEIRKSLLGLGDHTIIVIQILDEKEIDLKVSGNIRFHDAETKDVFKTFVSKRGRYEYQNRLKNHILNIEKQCKSMGVQFKVVSTEKPVFDTFYELLKASK
ncbi:TPA: DUF58 domain-containing protein [Candidatus Woesearchaeota archaeon]|nr:DUF58 domain-containing protein [Candidatus Woesearchaeota archaeon]HIH47778.1 DUF58 domain-containing protein [Candidatus Woesearchaeota archaeon]HII88201.1 DUF58 domain-containing protein [Candidatus Woesearchaeota archaeon]